MDRKRGILLSYKFIHMYYSQEILMVPEKFIPYTRHEITDDDIEAVANALKSDWITTGPTIQKFEDAFSGFVGCKHSVAVSSCTAALDLSINVLELPKDSEIITTPFSFAATSNSILYNDMKPVFCDIDKETFNIDPKLISEKITYKTKAVLCVDYAGQPCDYKKIKKICSENGLVLIEDAAHSLGAEFENTKTGNIAGLTSFSLHAAKNVTTGEGGIITTNNAAMAEKLAMLRSHGIDTDPLKRNKKATWKYDMKLLGKNYRMTDFQCALGISQLARTEKIISKRAEIASLYNNAFKSIGEVRTPIVRKNVKCAWHLYTILLNSVSREELYDFLWQRGIGGNVHYIPIYKHSYYKKNFPVDETEFPVTEDVFRRILTLPLFQTMTDQEINRVISAVTDGVDKLS